MLYLRERLRVLHRGRGGRGDHCGGGAELRVLAPAAHRARTAGAPIAAITILTITSTTLQKTKLDLHDIFSQMFLKTSLLTFLLNIMILKLQFVSAL